MRGQPILGNLRLKVFPLLSVDSCFPKDLGEKVLPYITLVRVGNANSLMSLEHELISATRMGRAESNSSQIVYQSLASPQ